jgi:hypothetical protein
MKSVQRNLKSSLTSNDLINLGIETDWETGELTFDTDVSMPPMRKMRRASSRPCSVTKTVMAS